MVKRSGLYVAVALACLLATNNAVAQKKYDPGATDIEIKIGQNAPFSGPASSYSILSRVQSAYLKAINERGGINGRKITLLSRDDGYSPPKSLEVIRQLVEDDQVLAIISPFGTPTNAAIQKYLNQNKVPHVFASAGGRRFNDPQNFPWTVPFYPAFEMEGATFGNYILKNMPNARIAVLYQNDDYGKDYLTGLKKALGDNAKTQIVAEANYELTYPTIDSQVIQLKASGADTLIHFTTPKFAAQALKKVHELNWTPTQFLASPVNSVQTVLTPAGPGNGCARHAARSRPG